MTDEIRRIKIREGILSASDYQCPAVQKAIDDLAAEFRDSRVGLLTYLEQGGDLASLFCGSYGNAWFSDKTVKLATGASLRACGAVR